MKLNELEMKIQLESEDHFQSVFDRCEKVFGPPVSQMRQLDKYYDTSDSQLKKQDLVIRIRSMGDQRTIALKSPRVQMPHGASSRIELEFVAAEAKKVEEQLSSQGLQAYEASEKERWTFTFKECEIVIDRLPFIGSFVEIEGPTEAAILEIVQLLHLSSFAPLQKNYGELIAEKFKKLGLSQIHATFAAEAAFNEKSSMNHDVYN